MSMDELAALSQQLAEKARLAHEQVAEEKKAVDARQAKLQEEMKRMEAFAVDEDVSGSPAPRLPELAG